MHEADSQDISQAQPVLSYAKPDLNDPAYTIAFRQKMLIFALLARVVMTVIGFTIDQPSTAITVTMTVAGLSIVLWACIAIIMLSLIVYSSVISGIVMGVFSLIPLLGLIPMLFINQHATKMLIKRGLKVGLFGTNLKEARRVAAMGTPDTTSPEG